MSNNKFGDRFTELRVSAGFSLRKFCKEMKLDAGNWSRVETGVSNPPTDDEFYDKAVKLFDGTEEIKNELVSLANAVKILPKDLQNSELMEHMPVMLRKINGQQLKEDEIENLVKWIKDTVKKENE